MSGQYITDKRLIAELNDEAYAQKAGIDYNKVKNSATYKRNLRKFGTGFRFNDGPGFGQARGSFLDSVNEGFLDAPLAITQGLYKAGNFVDKKLGTDFVDDSEAEFASAVPKVRDVMLDDQRQMQGRGGFDGGRLIGGLFTPVKNVKALEGIQGLRGIAARGAAMGAQAGALQPVTNDGNFLTNKAAQATTGAIFGAAVNTGFGKVAQRAHTGDIPSVPQIRANAAERQGMDLAYSQLTDSGPTRAYADLMSNFPGGGSLRKQAARTVEKFDDKVKETVQQTGRNLERTELGDHLERTLGKSGYVGRFENKADELYKGVERQLLDAKQPQVNLQDTLNAMTESMKGFTSNPELGEALANPKLRQISDLLTEATDDAGNRTAKKMFFNEASALRSRIGRMLGDSELINDIPRRELSQVYGALTRDMRASLAEHPQALKEFDKASRFYRIGRQKINNVIEPLLAGRPEQTADRIVTMLKNDAYGARTIRQSMRPEEWDDVAATMFGQLGKATPSEQGATAAGFSIPKFLTDFNTLRKNPQAFDWAFGGTRYTKLRDTYGDLAEIAESIKHSQRMANTSRTAYSGGLTGLGAAFLTNPGVAFKAVAANYALARALASPRFARWMLKMGKMVQRGKSGLGNSAEVALKAHISKLPAIAAADSGISDGINSMYEYFTGAN